MPGSASGSVSFGVSGSVSAGAQVMGQSELMGGGSGDEAARGQRPRLPATRIRDGRMQRLEAVLLLAREPLNSRKLAQFANLADGTEARTLVRKLNEAYDAAGRAFRVEEVASGYQLFTRPGFATWLRKLGHVPAEMRLSAPALETLAVIAYRQPVPRADIEAIRGVNCGEILRQLMERDLARISGRSDELGRPFLYGTTRRFLQVFGLVDLDELPRAEKLRGAIARSSAESGSLG
jgi:segregation and condensation protein B